MTVLDKIEKLLVNERYKGDTVTVTWELCDPKDFDGDTCTDVDIEIGFYYTPEERDVGVSESFEVEEVNFDNNTVYMGKKYRNGQAFPKQLRKHVLNFRDPGFGDKFKKGNWDSFVYWELLKKLNRLDKF